MTPDELFDDFVRGFPGRKFSAGLLVAFIDFLIALGIPSLHARSFDNVLARFPRRTTTAAGKRANTLIVDIGKGRTSSLRPFYNDVERFYRAEHKRFDYPSCAPHATQAWADYMTWLNALATFSERQLKTLRTQVNEFVLQTLVSQEFDPASVLREPPLFEMLLKSFDLAPQKGETSGMAFQGVAFGFLRADNAHLQVEIDKVRTGSKRLQRIGDIDAWEGGRLAITAEVKQFILSAKNVDDLKAFANEAGRRGAIGMVFALDYQEGVKGTIEGLGLRPLDVEDILSIVSLWDPMKQRTAVASLVYYVQHVEKNAALTKRLKSFLSDAVRAPG